MNVEMKNSSLYPDKTTLRKHKERMKEATFYYVLDAMDSVETFTSSSLLPKYKFSLLDSAHRIASQAQIHGRVVILMDNKIFPRE